MIFLKISSCERHSFLSETWMFSRRGFRLSYCFSIVFLDNSLIDMILGTTIVPERHEFLQHLSRKFPLSDYGAKQFGTISYYSMWVHKATEGK